ncbi:M14 family zinc carboxypeptidase [Streptomyces sp. LHD-70]|uniref:M14 family zinc carboxypeptidase n=1 Tax=Streptomyces sp. LHD-70 TaxID=3072140 RepID=UPI00280EEDCA|nr:M14 family zinc carboxypeptidase [Streptomyces sp. LHD-70]MDQ8703684.1 M14 family zinc carboxypeptidase [Streptomyces sp. LHD-70]
MSHLTEQHYPSVTELVLSARALVAESPDLCELRRIGTSRAGRPLHLLSVGRAEQRVLVVAGAHSNEPVGGPTALHLARRAVHEEQLRSGTSWHFLLSADPDGAALHRASAPRSLFDYHRHFFRPAGPEQPEWAPSVLPPDEWPPETRALLNVIDELRPYLQVSLHGTDLGGSWVQLTQDIPGLAEPFAKSAAQLHIPIETSTSDAAGWPIAGPGVHVMPDPGTDALFPSLPEDVTRSTWHHVHRYGGSTAIVEVPMWASDLVDDPARHPAPHEALQRVSGRLRAQALRVEGLLQETGLREAKERSLPEGCGPLLRASRWALGLVPGLAEDWLRPPPKGATMTYVSSIDAFGRRLPLRAAAMLLRVLDEAGDPAAARLERLVAQWSSSFESHFKARWVPLEHQVEHQSRTAVAAARHARVKVN